MRVRASFVIFILGITMLGLGLSACGGKTNIKAVSIDSNWEFFRTKENPSVLLVREKNAAGRFFYQVSSEDPNFLSRYLLWRKGARPQPLGRQRNFERQADIACNKNDTLPPLGEDSESTYVLETSELVNTDSLIELVNHYFPQARDDQESLESLFKHPGAIGASLATISNKDKSLEVVAAFIDCRDPRGRRFALAQARSYSTDVTIGIAQYIKHIIRYKRRRGDQIGSDMTEKERASLNSSSMFLLVRGLRAYAKSQDKYARWLRTKEAANSMQRYVLEDNINTYNLVRDLTRLNGERSDQLVRSMEFKYNRERKKFPNEMPRISRGVTLRAKDLKAISLITR